MVQRFKVSFSDCTRVSRSVQPSIRGLSLHIILRAVAAHTFRRPLRSWEIKGSPQAFWGILEIHVYLDADYLLLCLFDLPIHTTGSALPSPNHVQPIHVEALACTPHLEKNPGQPLCHSYHCLLIAMPRGYPPEVRIKRIPGFGRMVGRLAKQHAKFT